MGAVVVLAGLAFTAVAALTVFAAVAVFFKIVFRLVLLPLLLLKWIVMGVVMLVVGPILFIVGLAAAFALLIPLLPFVALGAIVWLLVRSSRRPVRA
ncbi:MAG TPA: hypothetical protein VF921_05830 [Vicinamibacterales bacterium]